eukprot:UN24913
MGKVRHNCLAGWGNVKDRARISDFTGESANKLGGFPVNSPDCMVQDQSSKDTWKNLIGSLYDTFNKRKNLFGKLWTDFTKT